MTQVAEAQAQQKLVQTPEGQRLLQQLAIRRGISALALIAALGLFLLWLPLSSRRLLISSLIGNLLLLGLLIFGLMAISLLWSSGQVLDVWLFRALTLRSYS